jgi:hypothetical protein
MVENRLFGSVGGVCEHFRRGLVELGVPAPVPRRQSREARNRPDPGRNLRTAFETAGLAPYVDEDLTYESSARKAERELEGPARLSGRG